MPVPASKSTGSLAQSLPRAKPPVMTTRPPERNIGPARPTPRPPQVKNLGPVRMSNAKRAQVGLKPSTYVPQVPRASPKRPMVKLSPKQIMQMNQPARVPMNKGVKGSAIPPPQGRIGIAIPRSKNVMYKK